MAVRPGREPSRPALFPDRVKPRPASPDFRPPHDRNASKADVGCSSGQAGPASWSRLTNQEDDHGNGSADHRPGAATRALEQGQAYRSKAAIAAKTCLVDQYPTADGRADPRLGNVQSRH